MRFLHVEKEPDEEEKKMMMLAKYKKSDSDEFKFIKPSLKYSGRHDFNLHGALYLSKATDDDSSMWLEYRKHILKKSYYMDQIYDNNGCTINIDEKCSKLGEYRDSWLYGRKKHFFEIDVEKDRIYVIDTPCQLLEFFVKYGNFTQEIIDFGRTKEKKDHDMMRLQKFKQVVIIDKFLDNLDLSYKEKIYNTSKFEKVKEFRNKRNMPIIKFTNRIVIPKKGISFEFLVDIVRTKEKYIKFIGDIEQLLSLDFTLKIESLNFKQLSQDGYNGLYYSTNIVKFVSEEEIASLQNMEAKEIQCEDFIQPIDIGEFPDVLGYSSKDSLKNVKEYIEDYIRWLGSDTLIMWNM